MDISGPEVTNDRAFAFTGGLEDIGNVWYKVNYATNVFNRQLEIGERGAFVSITTDSLSSDSKIQNRESIETLGKHSGVGEIITVQGDSTMSILFTFETTIEGQPWLIAGQVQELTEQGTRLVMKAIRDDLEIGRQHVTSP